MKTFIKVLFLASLVILTMHGQLKKPLTTDEVDAIVATEKALHPQVQKHEQLKKPLTTDEITAVVSLEKALHPAAPKNRATLFKEVELPAEKKPIEEIAKKDVGAKKWFYIESLKPRQYTKVTGKSGTMYNVVVKNDGTLDVSIAGKKK